MLKKIMVLLALMTSFPAFASIIQTHSFVIANVDAGAGKLSDENAFPFGVGIGYQWNISYNLTAGLEGAYFNNGHVSSNGNTVNSYELVPLASIYYYPEAQFNLFGKLGYGWQINKVSDVTSKNWEPVGIVGMGYVIPFSQSVYANVYSDLTWSDSSNNTLAGNHLNQNTQIKVGIQFMF